VRVVLNFTLGANYGRLGEFKRSPFSWFDVNCHEQPSACSYRDRILVVEKVKTCA